MFPPLSIYIQTAIAYFSKIMLPVILQRKLKNGLRTIILNVMPGNSPDANPIENVWEYIEVNIADIHSRNVVV